MSDLEQKAIELNQQLTSIDEGLDRIAADNRTMRRLLSQAALFIAMQPTNAFRQKWLEEVERLTNV